MTDLLHLDRHGDSQPLDELMPVIYDESHELAIGELPGRDAQRASGLRGGRERFPAPLRSVTDCNQAQPARGRREPLRTRMQLLRDRTTPARVAWIATTSVRLALFSLAIVLASCAEGLGVDSGSSPSIVIVTIDTLRADHLGAYGYFRDTSPVLDRLAEESLFFSNVVAPMTTTLPSHASLFTSRYPIQTGVTSNRARVRLDGTPVWDLKEGSKVRLFAEILSDLDYTTAAFVSATPVKSRTGIASGFQLFDQPERRGRSAEETTTRVIEWLERTPSEPFFLWVHYFDPHKPYLPPKEFQRFETDERLVQFLADRGVAEPVKAELLKYNNLYDGEILSTDSQIGRLLDALRSSQLQDRSALVVTSDHGEALGEHGRVGHGAINNEQLFVPLMVRFPAENQWNGRRHESLVSLIDILPMLVDELRIPMDPAERARFTGINPLDRSPMRTHALVQRSTRKRSKLARLAQRERFGLVSLRWKYVFNSEEEPSLFDMQHDRAELNNLVSQHADIAHEMKQELLAEIALHASEDDFQVVEETLPVTLQELRALGYLD